MTIIVVIRLDDIQTTCFSFQASFESPLGEGPIAIASEIMELVLETNRRNHDVQKSVAIEVFQDASSR